MASLSHRVVLFACMIVGVPLSRVVYRLRLEGKENVPRRGAYVLCANHTSFLDPIVLHNLTWRPIHYLMSAEFYEDPRLKRLYRVFEVVPTERDKGAGAALARAGALLRRGGIVGIFPEGGISRDGRLGEFKNGAAILALRHGVPLVPVWIAGTYEAMPRRAKWPGLSRLLIRVGEPILPERAAPGRRGTTNAHALTRVLREAIAALAPDRSRIE